MSKDTIYREDAIMALRLEYPAMPMFKELREEWAVKAEGYRKAEEVIMRLPSADSPQGEWIEMYRNGFGSMICMCSKCNFQAPRSNFCPNCGADMRKGTDDE